MCLVSPSHMLSVCFYQDDKDPFPVFAMGHASGVRDPQVTRMFGMAGVCGKDFAFCHVGLCLNFSSAVCKLDHLNLFSVSYVLKSRKPYLAYSLDMMVEVMHKMVNIFPSVLSHLLATFRVGSYPHSSIEMALLRSWCQLCS